MGTGALCARHIKAGQAGRKSRWLNSPLKNEQIVPEQHHLT